MYTRPQPNDTPTSRHNGPSPCRRPSDLRHDSGQTLLGPTSVKVVGEGRLWPINAEHGSRPDWPFALRQGHPRTNRQMRSGFIGDGYRKREASLPRIPWLNLLLYLELTESDYDLLSVRVSDDAQRSISGSYRASSSSGLRRQESTRTISVSPFIGSIMNCLQWIVRGPYGKTRGERTTPCRSDLPRMSTDFAGPLTYRDGRGIRQRTGPLGDCS